MSRVCVLLLLATACHGELDVTLDPNAQTSEGGGDATASPDRGQATGGSPSGAAAGGGGDGGAGSPAGGAR